MSDDQKNLSLGGSPSATDDVEKYEFEPIKGYPMLNWQGKRPFRSTQYYPAQLKEVHGAEVEGWRNKIYWGDNLQVMSHLLKEYRGKVDLIYIDPPFDSGAEYRKRISIDNNSVRSDTTSFEDKQYTDIWSNDEYLQFMYERLSIIRELMSDTSTLWLHCDYHKSHFLKCMCDEIFGDTFLSEVIWNRAQARGNVKSGFSIAHDTILIYSRSRIFTWHPPTLEYSENYVKRFNQVDDDGRKYTLDNLVNPNPNRPNLDYEWKGVRRVWKVQISRMREYEEQGRLGYTSNGVVRYKRYLDELLGKPITTLWDDIEAVNSQALERQNYPTQKPEELLERIVRTSTAPDGLIFDCFMGSGTTQAVAMKLGRRFIGADINLGAIQTTTKRLINVARDLEDQQAQDKLPTDTDDDTQPTTYYTGFEVYNVNHYDVFRNPLEAKSLLIEALEIQPLAEANLYDGEKDGRMVKIMPVNRIATKADLNELISGFDYKAFERRQEANPTHPVEKLLLVCMGHEPDLAAQLQSQVAPLKIDVEVVDILRDKSHLEFKRDSEASVSVQDGELVIDAFYPMNLLQKLSIMEDDVGDWRELVESIMVDWNYDGAVLEPAEVDVPGKNALVVGRYPVPDDAGTIRIKITDLLSESLEIEVAHG